MRDKTIMNNNEFDKNEEQQENIEFLDEDKSNFLDDDEAFLAGEDTVLSQSDVLNIFQQSKNLVSYEVMNFLNEKGKPRSKMSLLNDPPILHIASSDQQSADFVLSKEFTRNMVNTLKDVDRAYLGISPKKEKKPLTQEGIRERFDTVLQWMKDNKVKSGLLVLLIVLFVGYSVFSFV